MSHLRTVRELPPPEALVRPASLGALPRVVDATTVAARDDEETRTTRACVGYSDGTIALFVLNGKERLSATTTTTTKEKIQCSWFKRRKRKANAFDYSTLGRDGNDDDDDDDDDDEELEEDQEEKDECVGVDCIEMTKHFIVRASGSGYQRASIDVLDARSGKSVISLRLPTCWPPECASFEVKCEEFEKGQIIVAATSCRTTRRSYENVVGCESAFAVWVPFRKKNGCDPVVSWNLGPHITLANERERVVEGFLCPTIRLKEKSLSGVYEEETRYFDVCFERVTELNGKVRATSGKTTISFDPVLKETEVHMPVTFGEDAETKIWGKTCSEVGKARKEERDKGMSDSTYQREFGVIKGFRGSGVLLIYFPSGEAIVRAFADPAARRVKTGKGRSMVSKATLSVLEQSLRTTILGSQGRELESIYIENDDNVNVFSMFILSRDVDEHAARKSNLTSRAVLQHLRVPFVTEETKSETNIQVPHFSSTKTLLDDLLDTKESDNNDKIKNEEERACALCLESEHELGKSKNIDITLNDMPCCSSTICKTCLLAYVRQYPGAGCPSCRNVPMFHAFAGSDKSVSPGNDQQYKVVVKTQIIDIESFNTREGLASALARATLESTGSELEDLELFESSRGKREKYAFCSGGKPRTVATLGANGVAYANTFSN